MIHRFTCIIFSLLFPSIIGASVDKKAGEKPSLRGLRAALTAQIKKDESNSALQVEVPFLNALHKIAMANPITQAKQAHAKAAAQKDHTIKPKAHPDAPKPLPKEALAKLFVSITVERAKSYGLSIAQTSAVLQIDLAQVIGQKAVGSKMATAGKSALDEDELASLGYKHDGSKKYSVGEPVLAGAEAQCYYGVVVGQKDEKTYWVQLSDNEVSEIDYLHMASK